MMMIIIIIILMIKKMEDTWNKSGLCYIKSGGLVSDSGGEPRSLSRFLRKAAPGKRRLMGDVKTPRY